jgi:hypothetical protein
MTMTEQGLVAEYESGVRGGGMGKAEHGMGMAEHEISGGRTGYAGYAPAYPAKSVNIYILYNSIAACKN